MTPVQIAVMALAHGAPKNVVAVWGSWQKAASELVGPGKYGRMLLSLGTTQGTRELEGQNLNGKTRRGAPGRLVHLYVLADILYVRELAARCAWAMAQRPAGGKWVTWKDVPDHLPQPTTWPEARYCPGCGCTPAAPCWLELENGCGEGHCVPAGAFGFKRCSSCALNEAA